MGIVMSADERDDRVEDVEDDDVVIDLTGSSLWTGMWGYRKEDVHNLLADVRHVVSTLEERLAASEARAVVPPAVLGHSSPHPIVIVDDDPDVRFLLRLRLGLFDNIDIVGEASNGVEAIELLRTTGAQLVVIDLEMPKMNGLQAIPHLRAMDPNIVIVLYTSAPELADGLDAANAPDAIVDKWHSVDRLVDCLETLLVEHVSVDRA